MKKKIKDLTYEERRKICVSRPCCVGCPLYDNNIKSCLFNVFQKLEEEIEVELKGNNFYRTMGRYTTKLEEIDYFTLKNDIKKKLKKNSDLRFYSIRNYESGIQFDISRNSLQKNRGVEIVKTLIDESEAQRNFLCKPHIEKMRYEIFLAFLDELIENSKEWEEIFEKYKLLVEGTPK